MGAEASYRGTVSGLSVVEQMDGCHPIHENYPLLPGDLLMKRADGTFYKFGPGLGIEGFVLTEDQEASLVPVVNQPFGMGGMDYFLSEAGAVPPPAHEEDTSGNR